jgi:hypothetical protein
VLKALQRLSSPFSEFGWTAGLAYVVDRALNSISARFRLRVYDVVVQPIVDKPLLKPSLARHIELREIRRGDPELALMPVPSEIKDLRFEQNAICLGVFKRNEFVGYMWFCFGRYEEDEVRCTYELISPAESVFDFDLYLFPEHRMGLAFVGAWNSANAFLRSRDVKYTFSRLNRFNLPSRRAHKHLGCQSIGRTLFLQLGRFELMLGTMYPFIHLSLDKLYRVNLRIDPRATRRQLR